MPRTKARRVRFTTFGEVLRHLKGISPRRIQVVPAPGTATVRDVIRLDRRRHEIGLFELVDGVLVAKVGGFWEAVAAGQVAYPIQNFQMRHNLGVVVGAGGLMQLASRLVRAPTVSFDSWEQLPDRLVTRQPVPRLHPDLAVEIPSPENTKAELARKRADYFTAGTRLVWQVDLNTQTVDVYNPTPTRSPPLPKPTRSTVRTSCPASPCRSG